MTVGSVHSKNRWLLFCEQQAAPQMAGASTQRVIPSRRAEQSIALVCGRPMRGLCLAVGVRWRTVPRSPSVPPARRNRFMRACLRCIQAAPDALRDLEARDATPYGDIRIGNPPKT
eukprot:2560265-Pleurochrysis_carterae.AAC.1